MPDIFFSYAREDRPRISSLVEFLTARGLDVWWDRNISPGDSFEESIDKHILDSRCVIVVWSKSSINSRWVKNEALEGLERDILVPLLLDPVRIPVAFRQTQGADFTSWPGQVDEHEVQSLLTAIYDKLGQSVPEMPAAADVPKQRKDRHWYRNAAIFLGVVLLAVGWLLFNATSSSTEPAEKRMAVLRFKNVSDPGDTYIADSLASEIHRRLKSFDGVKLVSQFASWDLPAELTTQQITDRLDAQILLSGSVIATGPAISLMVRLESPSGQPWQREYDASVDSIQALTLRVIDHLAIELKLPQSPNNEAASRQPSTASPQAFNFYLKGRDLQRRATDSEMLEAAKQLFNEAIQQDSRFELAYSALCGTSIALYERDRNPLDFENAERSCNRALTLEPSRAEVYRELGNLYFYSGQHDRAEAQVRKALAVDPSDVDAFILLGYILSDKGDQTPALAAFDEAVRQQPGYWRSFNARGVFNFQLGRYPGAVEDFSQVTRLDPTNVFAWNNLGTARYVQGQFKEAINSWEKSNAIKPSRTAMSNLGTGYYYLRDYSQSAKFFENAMAENREDHRLWGNLADAQRMAKDTTAAAANYQAALSLAQRNLAINSKDASLMARIAVYNAALGHLSAAQENIDMTLQLNSEDPLVTYDLTIAMVLMGSMQAALASYQSLLESGFPKPMVEAEPAFDDLRKHL